VQPICLSLNRCLVVRPYSARPAETTTERGGAQSSGVALTETYAACTLKDGTLIRQREFVDHPEALEAAGLAE